MNSHEERSLALTSAEYSVLLKISDCSDKAEMIIMTRKVLENGTYIISGNQEDFEELSSTISEELDFKMCKKKDRDHLINVLEKVDSIYYDIHG